MSRYNYIYYCRDALPSLLREISIPSNATRRQQGNMLLQVRRQIKGIKTTGSLANVRKMEWTWIESDQSRNKLERNSQSKSSQKNWSNPETERFNDNWQSDWQKAIPYTSPTQKGEDRRGNIYLEGCTHIYLPFFGFLRFLLLLLPFRNWPPMQWSSRIREPRSWFFLQYCNAFFNWSP